MKRMSRDTKFVLGGTALLAAVVGAIVFYEKRASAALPPATNPPPKTCPPGQYLDANGNCQPVAHVGQVWVTLNWQAPSQGPQPAPVVMGTSVTIHVGQSVNFTLPSQPTIESDQSIAAPVIAGPTPPGPGVGGINVGGYSLVTGIAPGSCMIRITSGGNLWAEITLTVIP